MLNETRDVAILRALCRYFVLNRVQIQRLLFPSRQGDRIARRRLQFLHAQGYINRTRMQVVGLGGTAAPAYYPARKGCELLAEFDGDEAYALVPTQPPQPHHLFHWLAVSETHLALDAALALQEEVACPGWLNEWDVANREETDPQRRFRLYTVLSDRPRLVCAPDAAFLLEADGHTKVFYLEQDRNTSGVRQVVARKAPGYATLADRGLHRRHFPAATVDRFSVLTVAPTPRRRDALCRAMADQPGADLWWFAAAEDLTPERLLHDPLWHRCDGRTVSLVKPRQAEVAS